jgi:hypothetical protein
MLKSILVIVGLLAGSFAMANEIPTATILKTVQQSAMAEAQAAGVNWAVGDACHYNLSMASFIQGKLDVVVREKNTEGYWLDQNVDLGFLGKQTMSVLIDPNTGTIKKVIVDGKEQAPPEQGEMEVIEVKESKVTVPAGTFDAVYFKVHDKKQNQDTEQWVNPKLIPISGMIKTIGQSQMGEVVTELASFEKK